MGIDGSTAKSLIDSGARLANKVDESACPDSNISKARRYWMQQWPGSLAKCKCEKTGVSFSVCDANTKIPYSEDVHMLDTKNTSRPSSACLVDFVLKSDATRVVSYWNGRMVEWGRLHVAKATPIQCGHFDKETRAKQLNGTQKATVKYHTTKQAKANETLRKKDATDSSYKLEPPTTKWPDARSVVNG